MPKQMQADFGGIIKQVADRRGREISPEEIWEAFRVEYLAHTTPYNLREFRSQPAKGKPGVQSCSISIDIQGQPHLLHGQGNGPIDACCDALRRAGCARFEILDFDEHSREAGSEAEAVAYIQVRSADGKATWGVGMDTNSEKASIMALFSALNRAAHASGAAKNVANA